MIIVELAGGLGNQMFQYAAGRCLSERHHVPLALDLSFLLDRSPRKNFVFRDYSLDIFGIPADFSTPYRAMGFGKHGIKRRIWRMIYPLKRKLDPRLPLYVRESPTRFDLRFFSIPSHAYIEGYWQSERYFKDIEPIIREAFSFQDALDAPGREMSRKIAAVDSVCVFVRRAEFLAIPKFNRFHGVCEAGYFLRAIDLIASKIAAPHFFVFSDDMDWCRETLTLGHPVTFVGHDCAGRNFGQYFRLMAQCRHHILSNSSYGWWAAWLNANPAKVVVAPKRWYRDSRMDTSALLPEGWIKI